MIAQGNSDQGYDALRQLVLSYPQEYLYETLAHLALQKGNTHIAKKYYLRSISLKRPSERSVFQQQVMQSIGE